VTFNEKVGQNRAQHFEKVGEKQGFCSRKVGLFSYIMSTNYLKNPHFKGENGNFNAYK